MTRGWKHLAGVRLWLVSLTLMAACLVKYQPWSDLQAAHAITITSEAVRVAHNLSRSAEFADPFGTVPTGYTAHLAPGFPILVSALLKVFGDGAAGWIALGWLPILALSLQIALFPSFAKMLGYSAWTGVIAAIFALLTKPITYEQWEAHEAGLLIFVLAALMCRRVNPWLTGALAGLTICFQPIMALVYLAWVFLSAGRAVMRDRRTIPLLVAPAIICMPWVLRNQLRLGTPGIRDNLGIELYVSFNDCASYGFEQSQKHGCFGRFHPNQNLAEALALRAMGEASYNRDRMRRAFTWITHHPRRAGLLIAQRTVAFWFPPNDRWPEYLQIRKRRLFFFWALTIASFAGVWFSLRRRIAGARFLAALLAIYPLVYYVVQFDHRYRYPILWATWLAAAYLFENFLAASVFIPSVSSGARRGRQQHEVSIHAVLSSFRVGSRARRALCLWTRSLRPRGGTPSRSGDLGPDAGFHRAGSECGIRKLARGAVRDEYVGPARPAHPRLHRQIE